MTVLRVGLLAGFVFAASGPAPAEELVFRNGEENAVTESSYAGTTDAVLASGGGASLNYGAATGLLCGRTSQIRRCLLRFDLSGFGGKVGRKIRSVKLLLVRIPSSPDSESTFSVYEVAEGNAGWREGRGAGDEAKTEAGDCCWNFRVITSLPATAQGAAGEPWAGAVGLGMAGTDYVKPALAEGVSANIPAGDFVEIPLPLDLVELWIREPERNAGLLIRADDEASDSGLISFASANHRSPGSRPALIFDYEP